MRTPHVLCFCLLSHDSMCCCHREVRMPPFAWLLPAVSTVGNAAPTEMRAPVPIFYGCFSGECVSAPFRCAADTAAEGRTKSDDPVCMPDIRKGRFPRTGLLSRRRREISSSVIIIPMAQRYGVHNIQAGVYLSFVPLFRISARHRNTEPARAVRSKK